MHRRSGSIWIAVVAIAATLLASTTIAAGMSSHDGHGTPASGHDHGTTQATPGHDGMDMGSTGNGVVYLIIANDGDADDTLVDASTERSQVVEIHETSVENEVARMRPVEGPLVIPAGESVALEPNSLHMMLINLTADNAPGDVFDLTLTFERAGQVTIAVPVRFDEEPAESDVEFETVEIGDLTIEGAWSRPAPMLGGDAGVGMGTPEATPST